MRLYCNAKINLTLNITGKRADGYHLLDSIMQSVSLADELDIFSADTISVDCSNPLFSGEKNIAYKAATAFFDYTKITGGADIKIKKHIPDAAGLGGGSSDAAGVIAALNRIYSTDMSEKELCDIALKVGADVPFCIVGGTKRVQGIGEIITDAPNFKNAFIVIAKVGVKASTGEMYKRIDNCADIKSADNDAFIESLKNGDTKSALLYAENAFSTVTGLYGIDKILEPTNPLKVCLSGSGPSVFSIYENEVDAYKALSILNAKSITAFKTEPTEKSIIFE